MSKITQALELVAASKMKYFQKKALATRSYAWSLLDILELMESHINEHPFAEKRTASGIVFVLVTSDKGLCGSLNIELSRKLFQSAIWKDTDPSERILITIGKKSQAAALAHGVQPHKSFSALGEDINALTALGIVDTLVDIWNKETISKVILISPHYVSPFESHVTFKTFLPMDADMVRTHTQFKIAVHEKTQPEVDYLEPDKESVQEKLFNQLLLVLFLQSFYELKASEYSSRMVAMKKATDAARDIITDLSLEYNKVRQATITQQLAELASASDDNT
ncbi:MAG: F0F1 ATP synthase subunit gamma [Candidatus Pacebacteria bacterium]|jgi:F-type H+-transporting ATPase subunit gamma|nr:F0F1 ATP synthase subunit gamma [Candidatus Paceibacterota bacterium]